ncbi:hypothetical protein ONR75_15950 [Rhodopseudomonas sp. P2A-2r]|uniref:hypothetical protein n=1 Tax=Rhodopseudomonas sp. P2A-2r TaxID=2991972 RepID=UPI0022342364|nr:hypothetical protein [Rhodopseudomonas sp. P2A-2r]UZE51924.1 hypothetical protein ONR75_15950 [Rhodopseudomonas sp. P2A-2r]
MQEAEVQQIVAAVLAEQQRLHKEGIDDVVMKTVINLLTSFGFEEDERKELKKDFIHLRKWRISVESAEGLTVKVIVGTIVSGLVAAVWLGFKAFVGK